ncbi:hypothetical protein [Actinoplanes sp. NPDC026619]|uniref:hypothetical protein n=1 Tax=Actinoplanes sp. NPDC026619 TaxID=3155798 RepID=UPI0033E90CFF
MPHFGQPAQASVGRATAAGKRRQRVTSAASAGGAGGAFGVELQNLVFAWVAAAVAAERPLLMPDAVAGVVVQVGAQTGEHVDDVAARTDADNFVLFQAKGRLSLGKSLTGPLAEALEQAVGQYLLGRLPVVGAAARPLDPERDMVVLCTDAAAPATVRVNLAKALARTGSQPPGTPLGHELTQKQREALDIVLVHVRRFWTAAGQPDPDDEQLRRFLRALRVLAIDADEGRPDQSSAVAALATVVQSNAKARDAWPALVAVGQATAIARGWRDRAALGVALSQRKIALAPLARYAEDIAALREVSAMNLQAMQAEAVLPVAGGIYIPRGVGEQLAAAGDDNVLIVGDAGAGKSAAAQEFATVRSTAQDVVVLRAADIAGVNRIILAAPLPVVLRGWTGPAALLLIDGVDALRGAEDRDVLGAVVTGLRGSRWQVAATVRTFDARNNQQLRAAFPGTPVSATPAATDLRLSSVRHLLVGDLTDDELAAAVTALPLASLLAEAPAELHTLLRNPFNLAIAARLAEHLSAGQPAQLRAARSRVDLMSALWAWRVRDTDSTAREALLARISRQMVNDRRLRIVEAEPAVTGADSSAVQAMLSANVLSADGAHTASRRVLAFAHNILFDYAAALYVLDDPVEPARLLRLLDADPSLPLIVRPSFEMLVELLWARRDAGGFWPLCLQVAGSAHVLASLAFAARLLRLIEVPDDLAALAPPPDSADDRGGPPARQEFIGHLVSALRTTAVLADAVSAVEPLSVLAARLATNAGGSDHDAGLAANLISALQDRTPMIAGQPGADQRGQAIAALLDACRIDPQPHEQLAGFVARQLPHTIAQSAEVRTAVAAVIDDLHALRMWGGTVLTWLADCVVAVVPIDRGLARRIASTVLLFEETRDEQVTFGGGPLLTLNQSRRDQAAFSSYRLGQSFSALCTADLLLGAEIFCQLLAGDTPAADHDAWPLTMPGIRGWLSWGRDITLAGRDVGTTAAAALSAALADADPAAAQPAVAMLVERLHNTSAWTALMPSTDNADHLARALLPAMDSGALLAHPDTHAAAATLLSALAEHDPALAGRLEAAVLNAHALADANELSHQVKDALLGCLRPDLITSPGLAARLAELGPDGPPSATPRPRPTATFGSWSIIDRLSERGTRLASEAAVATIAALEEALNATAGTNQEDRPAAAAQLPRLFTDADAQLTTLIPLPDELHLLLVRAAQALAYDPQVRPETAIGRRVLAILADAATSPHAGKLQS